MSEITFELGPIRPPSEAESILLRLTRNCPWNKCAFCPVYKGQKFSARSVEEIKSDIDAMVHIRDLISEKTKELGYNENEGRSYINAIKHILPDPDISENQIRQVAFWMYHGMKSLFLQDADSLVMKSERVVEVLTYMREKFPSINRITSYTRAKTVSKKSLDELKAIRHAGLDRIHIGMESGSDSILQMICKGVTQDEQISAGQKAIEAGFELSEYFMPGVGGSKLSRENAIESAKVVNAVNPTFIRIRSVIPVPGTPLFDMYQNNEWSYPGEIRKVEELRLFIENIEGITSYIQSDHIMNLLEDVEGRLPDDKDLMLQRIDAFLAMNENDKESYIVGRRLGRYRSAGDLVYNPDIESIKNELKVRYTSLDKGVLEILWNYI
jgi:radical SAM superfamily enzyme YgiQ (UPF0313 family)